MKKYTLSDCYKRGASRVNKKKNTPIPLLSLHIARYNALPNSANKTALATLRASLADAVMRCATPKSRIRL